MQTNEAKCYESTYPKKKYLVTEEEVWRVESYKWLSDRNINAYLAASVDKVNEGYNYDLYEDDIQQKVSRKLRLWLTILVLLYEHIHV